MSMKRKAQSPESADLSCEVCARCRNPQRPADPGEYRCDAAHRAPCTCRRSGDTSPVRGQGPGTYPDRHSAGHLGGRTVGGPDARSWLHAPALRHRKRLNTAPALWRARTVLRDEPGSLQKITQALARLDTNILSIHIHPVAGGVLDEFVLSAPGHLRERELLEALRDGGGRHAHVWPTTALAMADGQTKALSLAARIAGNPNELPLAVAELLSARIVPVSVEGFRNLRPQPTPVRY